MCKHSLPDVIVPEAHQTHHCCICMYMYISSVTMQTVKKANVFLYTSQHAMKMVDGYTDNLQNHKNTEGERGPQLKEQALGLFL